MSVALSAAPTTPAPTYRDTQRLLKSLEGRFSGPPWADPMIPSLLDSLVLHLEAHLETDLDGDLALLGEEEPRLQSPVDKLVRDGYELLFRAKDLASRGRRQPRIRTTWVALGKAVSELRDEISKQEAAERRLLNEAYQRDIGARD